MDATRLTFLCVLFAPFMLLAPLHAEEKGCVPDIQSGWKVVSDGSCPIGDGLWGRDPVSDKGQFWVQCGMLKSLPKNWFATDLHRAVLQDQIVLLEEGSEYRCLAGPYDRYSIAQKVRDAMRKQASLKTAFVREVAPSEAMESTEPVAVAAVALAAPVVVAEPVVAPVEVVPEVLDTAVMDTKVMEVAETVEPEVLAVADIPTPEPEPVPEVKEEKPKAVVKRVPRNKRSRSYVDVAGLQSPKPRGDEQRYTDGGIAWWRATYDEARRACEKDGMSLVSLNTLKTLSRQAETRDAFPKRLPYWVKENRAFDVVMMVPMPLRGSSLIHVMCEE
ncbi:hypothetical protein [Enterovibrio coralii]|uniref:SPOR domain-containing protein n=1 Tax=Enterovibrio coralii TaxID=294935 RepID=A0A135IB38_9GAMM|nr:hypothetical protein [Enterovibrio coralii]KXF82662.1 hypothetical protein ATN88_14285 [Enterovibrio coralii]